MEAWMRMAIEAAAPTRPHPNPRVGAVLIGRDGALIGLGAHQGPGQAHAEVVALAEAGERSHGATAIVTLEPCAHHGKTPPCTEALVAAGVGRVVVGVADPDERVRGRGIAELHAAGIDVEVGVLANEVRAMDPGYFHHRETGLPRVTLKAAATLDGQVAALDGTSQWITGEAARRDVHGLRAAADVVMVGAGTVLADNPRLTVRLDGYAGPQPVPVIIAGKRPIPPDAAVLSQKALVFAPEPLELPAEVVVVPAPDGRVDLVTVLRDLAGRGHLEVLAEGGPTLGARLLDAGLARRGVLYLGAKIAGGIGRGIFDDAFPTLAAAKDIELISVEPIGPDIRIEYDLGGG